MTIRDADNNRHKSNYNYINNKVILFTCLYHFLGVFKRGGGFRGIRNRALIGCILHKAVNKTRQMIEGGEEGKGEGG